MAYIGHRVVCRHCKHQFVVRDPSSSFALSDSGLALLHRVDEVLEQAQQQVRLKTP
jgi:hypothetical protein